MSGGCPKCGKQVQFKGYTPHHVIWNHVDGTRCVKCHQLGKCAWCGPKQTVQARAPKRRKVRQRFPCEHEVQDVEWGLPIQINARLEQRSGDCRCGVSIVSVGGKYWLEKMSA